MSKKLHGIIVLLLFCISLAVAGDSINETSIDQSLLDEEYPTDLDTLEEFIQSYYLLMDSDQYLNQFRFLDTEHNSLENDNPALASFYQKLISLRSGLRNRVSIFQIGDSHIQSGYFAGTARSNLQEHFGNAGRGLTFPLRLAGTNQPDDYRYSSSAIWSRDAVFGLSGYSISSVRGGSLSVRTNDFFGIDNRHDRISLLTSGGQGNLSHNSTIVRHEAVAGFDNLYRHELSLSSPQSQIDLNLEVPDGSAPLSLQGLILERSQPGLIYHATGVNGASFRSYAANPEFFRQITALQTDLIIISLGTNDSQGNYRAENFRREMGSFMTALRRELPDTPVLFTLAPDTRKRGRTNADVYNVNNEIKRYAEANDCAWWDLANLMGGRGSIRQWKNQALAANDYLHFSPKGYMLQGYLLYQAILKSYNSHTENPR